MRGRCSLILSHKIKFQCVEPGQFRTDWSGRSLTVTDNDPAYDHIDVKERVRALHGTQQGDVSTKVPSPSVVSFAHYVHDHRLALARQGSPCYVSIGNDAGSSITSR